jgi:hypothetical protein
MGDDKRFIVLTKCRDLLQRYFFPFDYVTKPIHQMVPGAKRECQYLDAQIVFSADARLHIPFMPKSELALAVGCNTQFDIKVDYLVKSWGTVNTLHGLIMV